MPNNSSSSSSTQTALYALATLIVVKAAWNQVPSWVKDSILNHRRIGAKKDANDDLTNPATIYVKIRETVKLAHSLSEDLIPDDMPYHKLQCAFLSLVHLINEIDINEPQFRERYFSKDGVDVEEQEIVTLLKYLDLAQLAYDPDIFQVQRHLRDKFNYQLIRHDPATEPGCVGHFIAVDHVEKQVVVAIKGTSTISDVLTDILGKAVPHSFNEDCPDIRCHEGMYTATELMMEDTLHLVENFFLPAGYGMVITGHSLGAGVSCLLGMFFKKKFPDMPLQVYAFATPACCSYEAALSSADYITSIINNNDCVPRMSLMNVRLMNKLFMFINGKLEENNLLPHDFKSAKSYLKDLMTIDSNLLVTTKELSAWMEDEFTKPRDETEPFLEMELYVPGRVVSVWNHTEEEGVVRGKVTDGYSQVLRQIFIESNMLSNHACDSYRTNLATLLAQMAKDI